MVTLRFGVEEALGRESARLTEALRRRSVEATAVALEGASVLDALRDGVVEAALVRGPAALAATSGGEVAVAAVLGRDEARDILVSAEGGPASLTRLRPGARVGVAGARRRCYLKAHRADLTPVAPTNGGGPVKALLSRSVDAVIVPTAEARELPLERLGSEILDPKSWVPSAGQGAHVVLRRAAEAPPGPVTALDDPAAHTAFRVEAAAWRAFAVGGDAPMGVLAVPFGPWIRAWGMVAAPDGRALVRAELTGAVRDPEGVGEALAELITQRGGRDLLEGARP